MKKRYLLPLLLLALLCICATASAATIPGQQTIVSITDASGEVEALTDDSTHTVWTKQNSYGSDLTIQLYGASVGEIWIRNGHAYSANYYNHYDRPDVVKVTVYYQANRYTESYDSYRYRLADEYRPSTLSDNWNNGYQRLLLPKKYTGVTRIELTIESTVEGYGDTGATISDIVVAGGNHATATPKAYATATPKPYVVYVTPTPGPWEEEDDYVDFLPPVPDEDDDPLVDYITPQSSPSPSPSPTPYIQLIPPAPEPDDEPVEYPTEEGTVATLLKRIATRTGPSNYFDEPGTFFTKGDEVNVLTKAWDAENELWWFQVEFEYDGLWYRAYTPGNRIDLDPDLVPMEPEEPYETEIAEDTVVYYGPGRQYRQFKRSVAYKGYAVKIYLVEGDWAQIEYYDYASESRRRGWVVIDDLVDLPEYFH